MIVSLGTTRNLIVGSKTYALHSGDVITFGGSTHKVPIQDEVSTGRISIATFMIPFISLSDRRTPHLRDATSSLRGPPLQAGADPSCGAGLTTLNDLIESYTLQLSLLDR